MKIFWNDCGRGVSSHSATAVDVEAASLIWSDDVRGVKGNFLGLVDQAGNTIQFYFDEGIPDDVDDASHLPIVFMDFPKPEMQGSYARHVRIGDVDDLIRHAFEVGANHEHFGDLQFLSW
jgi:hypothetical protein